MARLTYIFIFSQFIWLTTASAQSHLTSEVILFDGNTDIAAPPTFEISLLDGSVLAINPSSQFEKIRMTELYDENLTLVTRQSDTSNVDDTLTKLGKSATIGHVGVTSFITSQNSFNWFSLFSFGQEGATTFFDNSDTEESLTATHILPVNDSILLTAGNVYGYFTSHPDSVFIEQYINFQPAWRISYPGRQVLALDREERMVNLTVAQANRVDVLSYQVMTGELISSYSIDLSDYDFTPLLFRYPETNTSLLAKATDSYEVSCFDSSGRKWGYRKLQMATSSSIDRVGDIQFDEEGNVYLTGIFYTEEFGSGVLVSKLSADGDLKWERRYDNAQGLKTWSSHSIIYGDILYVSGQETTESGGWSQFVVAYSLRDGSLIKESKTPQEGDYKFSTKELKVCDNQVLAMGSVSGPDREEFVLRKFDFPTTPTTANEVAPSVSEENFLVYPNPAEGVSASLKLAEQHAISYLKIVSIKGQTERIIRVGPGQLKFDTLVSNAGVYIITAYNENHIPVSQRKLIVR